MNSSFLNSIKSIFKRILTSVRIFGKFVNYVIIYTLLTIVYIFGVGLTFVYVKLARVKLLPNIKNKDSYWTDIKRKKPKLSDYLKQF